MKVTGSTIQQLDKGKDGKKPKAQCRRWRLWATTEQGRKSRRFEGTFTQAQEALKAFVSELASTVENREMFSDYARAWQQWREKSGNLSPNMVNKDKRNLNALARTELNDMRMDGITPEDCRDALLWLKDHPVKGTGELSNATVASFHVTLNGIFSQAVADGRLARNPMDAVKYPKVRTPEKHALDVSEMDALLDALDARQTDAHVMAVYLMLCLGLRRGEALALADADISDGFARIRASVKEADGKLGEPKSMAGARILPMPTRLAAKVEEWRELRNAIGLGNAPTLCCNTYGGVMRPQNMYKWWCAHREELGAPGLGMHELRHSNLSMMARHMSPFDLQRYAGWSSIAPARIYIHADMDAVSRAVSDAWCEIERTKNAPLAETGQAKSA